MRAAIAARRVHEDAWHANRRFMLAVAVIVAFGLLTAVVAGLAMRVARQADQRSIVTAQHQLTESQDNLVRSQVAGCESRVRSREDTRLVFLALLDLAARPDVEASPAATAFRQYVDEAYDPINCTYGTPNFGVDPDLPTLTPIAAAPPEGD